MPLLRQRSRGGRADLLDTGPLLARAGEGPASYDGEPLPIAPGGELGEELALAAQPALEGSSLVEPAYEISTHDRAVGARLGGLIGREFGSQPPPGRIRARFAGSAGQSFGAFLAAGVELQLDGEANDYVGKSMGGGRIVVRPPEDDAGDPVLLGNTILYGATGGELFCAGRAGERFAVRNSGAVAVVEGRGARDTAQRRPRDGPARRRAGGGAPPPARAARSLHGFVPGRRAPRGLGDCCRVVRPRLAQGGGRPPRRRARGNARARRRREARRQG